MISRASIRFYWEQQFREVLEERNLISRDHFSSREDEVTDPTTPWLRAFCRGGLWSHVNLCEVFLAIYLPGLGASADVMTTLKSRFFADIQKEGDGDEIP